MIAAFIRDRAQQWPEDEAIYDVLCTLAAQIARGEHEAALAHGELDDLLNEPPRPCDTPEIDPEKVKLVLDQLDRIRFRGA